MNWKFGLAFAGELPRPALYTSAGRSFFSLGWASHFAGLLVYMLAEEL